jgi:hypothetical protein
MPKKVDIPLSSRLEQFQNKFSVVNVGGLGTALILTRKAKKSGLPLKPGTLLTEGGGQVAGLSGNAINKILKEYGEDRRVGTEGGRTSRGTPALARQYADFLNEVTAENLAVLNNIEKWWVERIVEFFNTQPFNLRYDESKNLISMLEDLLEQALKRQQQQPGRTYVGAVLQHLVGAKLEIALPDNKIEHHGYSVADKTERSGDFDVGDLSIHCTTTPQESLLQKCLSNIQSGKRPLILTRGKMIGSAEELARSIGIADRVEILDVLQFVTMNLYELSLLKAVQRQVTIENLTNKYNEIIAKCEADQSLQIKLG